jgi:hypothetical protein
MSIPLVCFARPPNGDSMPEYRFYNFEQNGRLVISRIHLTLPTDDVAVEHAQKLTFGETVQVWQEDRLVATLAIGPDRPEIAI